MAALICLLGLLALVCVAQTAYVLRLRPILARYIREDGYGSDKMYNRDRGRLHGDEGHYSDEMYSRGRSRRRRGDRLPSRRSECSAQWSADYDTEQYDRRPSRAGENRDLWAARGSPERLPSREDSRYERMRRHRAMERAERCRLGSGQPQSFVRTPSAYYGSNSSSMIPALSPPREGLSGGAGLGCGRAEARGRAPLRARRVVSFPNLNELRAWGAACESQGYVYDGNARGYVQPVRPEGYAPEDALFPARTIWALDLVQFTHRVDDDDAYVRRNW